MACKLLTNTCTAFAANQVHNTQHWYISLGIPTAFQCQQKAEGRPKPCITVYSSQLAMEWIYMVQIHVRKMIMFPKLAIQQRMQMDSSIKMGGRTNVKRGGGKPSIMDSSNTFYQFNCTYKFQ